VENYHQRRCLPHADLDLHRRARYNSRRGEHDFFILDAPNWVNIIPLTKGGDVVMIIQWRHGNRRVHAGFRAGWSTPKISPMHAAPARDDRGERLRSDTIVQLGWSIRIPHSSTSVFLLAKKRAPGRKPVALGNEEPKWCWCDERDWELIATGGSCTR